jgi:hypothetical protein
MPTIVKLEGQDIPLTDEIAATDDRVRAALAPFYPDVANAEIQRKQEGEQTIITIVKRAGPKGASDEVRRVLVAAPRYLNPAVALCLELQKVETEAGELDAETLLLLRPRIEQALEQSQREVGDLIGVHKALIAARAVPAASVPVGF